MNKVTKILHEGINKLNLTKVRLKIDPHNKNLSNLLKLNGYEGYILNEDDVTGTLDVIVLGDIEDPIVKNIPFDCVDEVVSKLQKFRTAAISYLNHKMDISPEADIIYDINDANNIPEIENLLKEFGLNKESIDEVYKLYVLANDVIE